MNTMSAQVLNNHECGFTFYIDVPSSRKPNDMAHKKMDAVRIDTAINQNIYKSLNNVKSNNDADELRRCLKIIQDRIHELNIQEHNGEYIMGPNYYRGVIKRYKETGYNIPDRDNNRYGKSFDTLPLSEQLQVCYDKVNEQRIKLQKAISWQAKSDTIYKEMYTALISKN